MAPYFLLFLGLFLIFAEFYLPGAILGILGGVSIISGIFLFGWGDHSVVHLIFFIVVCCFSVFLLIRFAIWKILRAKPMNSIYSDDTQEGMRVWGYDEAMVGKKGVVVADLKPGGYISVQEGAPLAAISSMGYLSRGESVEVIGGEGQNLIVKKIEKGE